MERRRQARTPVNINALLIGEKTVPKGCRVMNVSQNGMQLQCEADGRLLTFKDGESVDVHLSILHDGKQKKLTIPSWVRHVAANSVDVEFHRTDPQLVDLIEGFRTSENHRIEASLGRADRRVAAGRAAVANTAGTTAPDRLGMQAVAQKPASRPFYSVVLAAVFIVCVITGGYVYTASIDSRITTLETMSERQSTAITELQDKLFGASLQEGRYASLNARMTALNDAFVSLENRLARAIPSTAKTLGDRPPATEPAAQQPKAAVPQNDSSSVEAKKPTDTPATATDNVQRPTRLASQKRDDRVKSVVETQAAASASLPAVEKPETPVKAAEPDKLVAAPAVAPESDSPTKDEPQVATKKPGGRKGAWVINLISSPDKTYVENFSRESGAAKHEAVLNSATVNGKVYWRLQITGFESAAAAGKHAESVKQALGVKDVWIFKQK